jgi:hypothetical protein
MQRQAAIARFLVEYDALETVALDIALRAVAMDDSFVKQTDLLLDGDGRLKLLERMAFARGVPATVMTELQSVLGRAGQLRKHHARLSQNQPVPQGDTYIGELAQIDTPSAEAEAPDIVEMPRKGKRILTSSVVQIQRYANEAVDLQRQLRELAADLQAFIDARAAANR